MNKYTEQFEGRNVPENIKQIAQCIMIRFTITGTCDGMYTANVIAHTCGIGDGRSNFTSGNITQTKDIAKRLQDCYGCNIFREDIQELENIINSGTIDKTIAIPKMKQYIRKLKKEKQICDEWRVDYLNREINETKENITFLELN